MSGLAAAAVQLYLLPAPLCLTQLSTDWMVWRFSLTVINYAAVSPSPTTSYGNGFMFCRRDGAHVEKVAPGEFWALKKLQPGGQLYMSEQPCPGLFSRLLDLFFK